jgi:prophage DNA circulation protein
MECRDWLSTLWPASYKGTPFYFESDDEEGGRDQIVHTFPHSDIPFVEDMGEAARYFSGAAYVHGDNVDGLEAALKAAFVSQGAGMLVNPLSGPVLVRLMTFSRHHERDKLGYVSFQVKFVREGASSAMISVPFALNVAFGAAEAAASAIVSAFASGLLIQGRPDYVVSAAVDGVAGVASALDVARTSYRVDPAASAVIRDALTAVVANAPAALAVDQSAPAVTALAQSIVDAARAISDALPAASAALAMLDIVGQFAVVPSAGVFATPNAAQAAANSAAVSRLARLAALMGYAEAVLRQTLASRPDGVAARAGVAERFEAELNLMGGADNAALFLAVDDLRGRVIEYLSRRINDLAPIINVETARILPSLFLAYRLYGDPSRAPELVARNRVRHPSFMPRSLVALAPN